MRRERGSRRVASAGACKRPTSARRRLPSTRSNDRRMASIDGLRGLAALSVFIFHGWLYTMPDAGRVGPLDRRRLRRPRAAPGARAVLRAVGLPAVAPVVRRRARRAPAARPAPLPARARGADRAGVLRRARRLDRPAVGPRRHAGRAPAAGRRAAAVLRLRAEHVAGERHEAQPADVVARRRGELLPRAAARSAGWRRGCRRDAARRRSSRSRCSRSGSCGTGRSPAAGLGHDVLEDAAAMLPYFALGMLAALCAARPHADVRRRAARCSPRGVRARRRATRSRRPRRRPPAIDATSCSRSRATCCRPSASRSSSPRPPPRRTAACSAAACSPAWARSPTASTSGTSRCCCSCAATACCRWTRCSARSSRWAPCSRSRR